HRPWREILGAFRQAARGLAAAHARGLVHRDFKPDNALVSTAGVVKVVDFGLATALQGTSSDPMRSTSDTSAVAPSSPEGTITASGAIAGTPGYMAPEQFEGAPLDARADQFAFCVALWEALFGEPPFPRVALAQLIDAVQSGAIRPPPSGRGVPATVRRALERGLSPRREDRFVDMAALVTALERDPRRRAVRGGAIALVLGAAAVAWGLGRRDDPPTCAGLELPGWDDATRRATAAAVIATGIPDAPATWARIERTIDEYRARWIEERAAACDAVIAAADARPDPRLACGERRAGELAAVLERIATSDADALDHAILAVARLPDPRGCAAAAQLGQRPPPPTDPEARSAYLAWQAELAAADAAFAMSDLDEARRRTSAALEGARAIDRPDCEAEARFLLARIERAAGAFPAAREAFEAAYWGARASGHDAIAAMAAIDLGEFDADERPESAASWLEHGQAIVDRLGGADPLRGRLLTNLGIAAMRARDLDRAVALQREALAIYEQLEGDDGLGTAVVLQNLGILQFMQSAPDDETRATLSRVRDIFTARLGAMHPDLAEPLVMLASLDHRAGRLDDAEEEFRETLTLVRHAHGENSMLAAQAFNGLALVAESRGDDPQALVLLEQAIAVVTALSSAEDLQVGTLESNLVDVLSRLDRHDEALARARHVVEIFRATVGEEHPGTSDGHCLTGRELHLLGRSAEAIAPLEACLRIRLALDAPAAYRWSPRLDLARALAATQAEPSRTRELLDLARRDAVEAGEADAIAKVDAALASLTP
ncbi:MAG: tetratricopeptide repeat protein, partial [Myxococcales bacterium]|nr:tetratricopeptide repeat protein [Myxococcales bacterium]